MDNKHDAARNGHTTQESGGLSFDPASIPSWRSSTPMGAAIAREHADMLRTAIDALPMMHAALLNLRHGLGPLPPLATPDMSRMLGISRYEIERILREAGAELRLSLVAHGMTGVEGCDEAICQAPGRSGIQVSVRHPDAETARAAFDAGVVRGTHSLVDTPERARKRAQAARDSEKVDPAWAERDQAIRSENKRIALALRAERRAALAAATAVLTRAAMATPTLSVGLKADAEEKRFAIYAFDGRDDEGTPIMGGVFQDAEAMERRFGEIVRELSRYRDRETSKGRVPRRA